MIEYTSFMKPMISDFITYQTASQHWSEVSYGRNLKTFENYCLKNYPNSNILTQEMIDGWCFQRDSENNNSYISRINVIRTFLKYTNSRGLTDLQIPVLPKKDKKKYIPHSFSKDELSNFFKACDNIESKINSKESLSKKKTIPVFYRLLYSSGMRTIEARILKRKNVDLIDGVINIEQSKGCDQHYVVLHDSMKKIMIKYDSEIDKLYPNREYFFPSRNDGHHTKAWVTDNFRELWKKSNNSYAVPYDLRHNYAITNINKWTNQGVNFTANLYYLSKSMGHTTIESTKYYYSLVPAISNIIEAQIGTSFDSVIPEVIEP